VEAELLPPAHLVDRERSNWADKGEARYQRIEQGPGIAAGRPQGDRDADERVDQTQEDKVRGLAPEIAPAHGERGAEIVEANGAHARKLDCAVRAGEHMEVRHFRSSVPEAGGGSSAR